MTNQSCKKNFFFSPHMAFMILGPPLRTELMALSVKVQSLNYWTARELPMIEQT